jgi:predicted O-methyltransferase YrrM
MIMLDMETVKKITDEEYTDILNSCGGRLSINDAKILYRTALEIEAKNIVEIGSMDGCSSMVFGYVAQQTGGHLYCIEPNPKGLWKHNMQRLGLSDYATLIMKSSPWFDLTEIPQPIDYILYDGDHRTRWALVDYHYTEPYVRPGGLLAFHDWTGARGVGAWVQRAVAIIREDDPELEEVARDESSNRGIIVFRKPDQVLDAKGHDIGSFSRRWKTW